MSICQKILRRKILKHNRLEPRCVPLSAIAWPYRWLFALTECGEQRSPASAWCECSRARRTQTTQRLCASCRCVPKPLSILSMRRRPIATYSGHARGEEFRGGGRIVNCYEVDFAPEIPNRYFEITPLFH